MSATDMEIPADIRNTARRMLEYGDRDRMFEAMARAILAERERCARIAETDTDWTVFQRRPKTDWKGDQTNVYAAPDDEHMPTPANVFAYANGIAAGRAIAAAIRSGE